jgi:hypothetical protein
MPIPSLEELIDDNYLIMRITYKISTDDKSIASELRRKGYGDILHYTNTVNMRKRYSTKYYDKMLIMYCDLINYEITDEGTMVEWLNLNGCDIKNEDNEILFDEFERHAARPC